MYNLTKLWRVSYAGLGLAKLGRVGLLVRVSYICASMLLIMVG